MGANSLDSVGVVGEVPGPGDEVEGQVVHYRIAAQQLTAKHIGQHTTVVV